MRKHAHQLFFRVFTLVALFMLPLVLFGQNKKLLEDKRKKLTKEIEITNKLLDKTRQNKTAAYERLVTLQNQIERREDLISTIENEVLESEEHIERNTAVIEALHQDVAMMKEEYGKIVRHSFRLKTLSNPLLFLLSADNLNQAFRRWLFLRKYNKFRTGQAEAIVFTQNMLSKKVADLSTQKAEKEQLLREMQGQRGTLSTELSDKNQLIQSLGADEAKLRSELAEKQKAKIALDNSIERIISDDVRKTEEIAATKRRKSEEKKAEVRKSAVLPTTPQPEKNTSTVTAKEERTVGKVPLTPAPAPAVASKTEAKTVAIPEEAPESNEIVEEDEASGAFKRQRGRLPWPVEGGFIARSYGKQKHPTLKNIEITNNGIDIRSSEDAPVKNIFDGKVAGVQFIPGHDYTVILQHGSYYTVYSNLSETSLSKGQIVKAGTQIGRVSTNPISGAAELHFELWRGKERLNPAAWIK
jgi:murein hydrolase activator